MKLGMFMMPVHPLHRSPTQTLQEDREAIILADRILVCTARPGSIKSEIRIDLPRPRNIHALQDDARYHEHYKRVWGDLASEMVV